jgi:hypothetical protein
MKRCIGADKVHLPPTPRDENRNFPALVFSQHPLDRKDSPRNCKMRQNLRGASLLCSDQKVPQIYVFGPRDHQDPPIQLETVQSSERYLLK